MTIASEQAFLPQPQHEQHPPVQHRTTQQAPADDSRPPPSACLPTMLVFPWLSTSPQ